MPTGVHLRDPREQLFTAAEEVLRQGGPDALTSRAVTAQASCAKGVLHRHFESFDAFLAEFVLDRIDLMRAQGAVLKDSAGTGTVVDNLTDALIKLFDPVAVSIVALVTFHNQVRARLREARLVGGLPVMTEIGMILSDYLTAEQERGRIAPGADIGRLAPTLVGTAHLMFAGTDGLPLWPEDVRDAVASVLGNALTTS
ncbi:TetR/AcrR family transcriptional regulator [[Actinomadura] parvosata]|uniref:TetR/AcrR family transcriptional regulator n=1 Tax=[Actinomadura] parvosata TaxID=1955412 RepID=UPI00406C1207